MINDPTVFLILSVVLAALLGIRFVVSEVRAVVKHVLALVDYIDDWCERRRLRKAAHLSPVDISLDTPKIKPSIAAPNITTSKPGPTPNNRRNSKAPALRSPLPRAASSALHAKLRALPGHGNHQPADP